MPRSVPAARPRSKNEIEMVARKIILLSQPECLTSPVAFEIERFFDCDLEGLTGVQTDYRELPVGVHGLTDCEAKISIISSKIADPKNKSARRFRNSTTAHETAHAILHVADFRRRREAIKLINNGRDVGIKLYREEEIEAYRNPEWQAWQFAKSLLMPREMVRYAVLKLGYNMRDLCETFDLHPAFVRVRLKELELLDKVNAL